MSSDDDSSLRSIEPEPDNHNNTEENLSVQSVSPFQHEHFETTAIDSPVSTIDPPTPSRTPPRPPSTRVRVHSRQSQRRLFADQAVSQEDDVTSTTNTSAVATSSSSFSVTRARAALVVPVANVVVVEHVQTTHATKIVQIPRRQSVREGLDSVMMPTRTRSPEKNAPQRVIGDKRRGSADEATSRYAERERDADDADFPRSPAKLLLGRKSFEPDGSPMRRSLGSLSPNRSPQKPPQAKKTPVAAATTATTSTTAAAARANPITYSPQTLRSGSVRRRRRLRKRDKEQDGVKNNPSSSTSSRSEAEEKQKQKLPKERDDFDRLTQDHTSILSTPSRRRAAAKGSSSGGGSSSSRGAAQFQFGDTHIDSLEQFLSSTTSSAEKEGTASGSGGGSKSSKPITGRTGLRKLMRNGEMISRHFSQRSTGGVITGRDLELYGSSSLLLPK